MDFARRKSAAKFLSVKTVSSKVVEHSLAYMRAHMVGGGSPVLPEIFHESDAPRSKTAISTVRFDFEEASLFTPCLPYKLNARMPHVSVQYVFLGAYV